MLYLNTQMQEVLQIIKNLFINYWERNLPFNFGEVMKTFIEALVGFAVMFGPALTIWLLQGVK
jgi:hypothetical protein